MLLRRIFHFPVRSFTGSPVRFSRRLFTFPSTIMGSIRRHISSTTVEPIVFFNFFALSFFHVSQHATVYRSVCLQNYHQSDQAINCDDLSHQSTELEDQVQQDASNWNMILALCYLLPAVASDMILGAWSDLHGRKVNILIGLTGLTTSCVAPIALAVYPLMSLYVLGVSNAIAGGCGGVAIVMISSYSYISDVVEDKNELTYRMLLVQVYRYVAEVTGSLSFSQISRYTNLAVTLLIAQCFFVVAFLYALVRLYQLPPAEMRSLVAKKRAKISPKYGIGEGAAKYGMPEASPNQGIEGHFSNQGTGRELAEESGIGFGNGSGFGTGYGIGSGSGYGYGIEGASPKSGLEEAPGFEIEEDTRTDAPKYGIGKEVAVKFEIGDTTVSKYGLGEGVKPVKNDSNSKSKSRSNSVALPNGLAILGGDDGYVNDPTVVIVSKERTKGGLCGYVYDLYGGVWHTIVRKRPGNQRTYVLLCSFLYFVYIMSEIGLQGSIFSLYVFHRPFFWSPSELGKYRGVQNLCSFLVNLLGALLINVIIHADDVSIMLLGIGSGIVHLILIGLAKDTWALYVATVFAAFGSLLIPALKSFMIRTVEQHEVGRTLAANGIAADLAFIGSTLFYSNLYTFTVSTYASTVFFVGAGLVLLCFFATIWIKIDVKRTTAEGN